MRKAIRRRRVTRVLGGLWKRAWRRLRLEPLESRIVPAITWSLSGQPNQGWAFQGPAPAINGQSVIDVSAVRPNPITGAVNKVAVDPGNPNVAYAATVNGGVWKTTNFLDPGGVPTWMPKTDGMGTLSISSIAIDPANTNVIYVGTALTSSARVGTGAAGIYKSADGGDHWQELKQTDKARFAGDSQSVSLFNPGRVNGMQVFNGALYVATSDGLERNTKGGAADGWEELSVNMLGLSKNAFFTDVVITAGSNPAIYAAAVSDPMPFPGTNLRTGTGSVYRGTFDDTNVIWTLSDQLTNVNVLKLATRPSNPDVVTVDDTVYVGGVGPIVGQDRFHVTTLQATFDAGNTWSNLQRPTTNEVGFNPAPDLNPGNQADLHFSLAVDPINPNIIYLGGDRQPSADPGIDKAGLNNFVGRIFREKVDPATKTVTSTDQIVGNAAGGTAPHADSRGITFVWTNKVSGGKRAYDLVETDDGGINKLTNAQTTSITSNIGKWSSLTGAGLGAAELVDIAYDSLSHSIIAGAQDIGVLQQTGLGQLQWTDVPISLAFDGLTTRFAQGDGVAVAVDPNAFLDGMPVSIHYFVSNSLGFVYRAVFRPDGTQVDIDGGKEFAGPGTDISDNHLTFFRANLSDAQLKAGYSSGKLDLSVLSAKDQDPKAGFNISIAVDQTPDATARSMHVLFPATNASNQPQVLTSNRNRVVFAREGIYESFDGGVTATEWVDRPQSAAGRPLVTALAYGGGGDPDVIYAARADGLISVRRFFGVDSTPTSFLDPSEKTAPPTVTSIQVDPNDWQTAYLLTNTGRIFRTTDAGQSWKEIASNLSIRAGEETHGLALIPIPATGSKPARTGLAVGGQGVFVAAVDPGDSNALNWVRFGDNIPNVTVRDLDYDAASDTLVAATAGRGAWTLTGVGNTLGQTINQQRTLIITGTNNADTIQLAIDASNSTLLDIYDGSNLVKQYPSALIDSIEVDGLGGNDQLIVNTENGVPSRQINQPVTSGGIIFSGGAGLDTLTLMGRIDALKAAPPDGAGGGVMAFSQNGRLGQVSYTGVENLGPYHAAINLFQVLRNGLQVASDKLGTLLPEFGGLGQFIPFVGMSLPGVISGAQPATPAEDPDAPAADGEDAAGTSFIRRLIEEGDNSFMLSDIGQSITTLDALRDKLDALDDIPGNVSYTYTPPTSPIAPGDVGSVRFDIQIVKDLDGEANVHIGSDGSSIRLDGTAGITANVALHLAFGIDTGGFYVDASSNPDPELVVSNIRVEDIDADGRFGLTDVNFSDPRLTVDPLVKLSADLREPGVDPLFGGTADGLLRLSELDENTAGLVQGITANDPDAPDVVLVTTLTPDSMSDGSPLPSGFPTSGDVRLTWDDVTDSGTFTSSADQPQFQDFYNLLSVDTFNLLDGLTDLSGYFTTQANTDLFGVQLSFSTSDLGTLLAGPATPFSVPDANVRDVTPVQTSDAYKYFSVVLTGGVDLAASGVSVGDTLDYNTAGGRKTGTISATSGDEITVRFDATATQTPVGPYGISVNRGGSMTRALRGALGELAVPARLRNVAPSLQSFIDELQQITGSAVTMTTSGTGASRVVQFAAHFDPSPINFSVPLDLGSLIPGLAITGTAPSLLVSADASFDLKFGLRLDPALATDKRFFLVADATPDLSLKVTATLDNPSFSASLGFLNVTVAEDASVPNNNGIQFTANVAVNLLDPGTDAATPNIITIPELTQNPDLVTDTFAATVTGSLGIAGLKITPSVNGVNSLGTMTVSLDPTSSNTSPGGGGGKIQSISDLSSLATRAKLGGSAPNFDNFNNLSPDTVLDALKAAISQLSVLGAGGPLAQKLPGLNKSLGELIDIGQEYANILGNPDDSKTQTAQAVADYLNPRLPAGSFVTSKVMPDAIEFAFTFTRTITQDMPIQLDLQSLGGAFSTDINGKVHITLTPTIHLTIGLVTTANVPIADRVYLNTSRPDDFVLAADANTGYVGGGAAVGGTASIAGIGAANIVQARLKTNPQLTVDLGDGGSGTNRLFLHDIQNNMSSLSNLVSGTFSGLIQAVVPIRVGGTGTVQPPNPNVTDPATAWISVLGKLQNLGSIDFNASTTTVIHNTNPAGTPGGVDQPIADTDPRVDPNQVRVYAYGVDTLINLTNINLNTLPDTLIGDIPGLLRTLSDLMRGKVLGQELPLIGPGLRDVSTSLFGSAADQLASGLSALAGSLTPTAIRTVLFNVIGTTLGALGDWDGVNPGSPDINDIQLIDTPTQKQFNFRLKKQLTATLPLDADFGFPGLGIHLQNSSIQAFANYDVLVRIGENKTQGFYFDTTNTYLPADSATRGTDEVILSSGVQFAGLDARGSLGFLSLQATAGTPQGGGANAITAAFKVNIKDPIGTDGRLLIAELGQSLANPRSLLTATATVDARLGLALKLGFTADSSGVAPSLRSNLYFNWPLFSADPLVGTANFGPAPSIMFSHVQLDVGGLVSSFLAPILEDLDPVIQAIKPVFDVLNYPIPGIADLANAFPDFADKLYLNELGANPPGTVGDIVALALKFLIPGGEFIDKAIDILDVVEGIIVKFHAVNGSVLIDLGDLDLGSRDIRSTNLSSLNVNDLISNPSLLVDFSNTVKSAVGNTSPLGQAVTSFIDNSVQTYMGKTRKLFSFPLFDDPRLGLGLLLGKDVDLFRFQPPKIDETLGVDLTAPFPLFPAIRFGMFGEVELKVDLTFGFDTYGIRNWLSTWLGGGAFDPARIFKGFYITDVRDGTTDLPEIVLKPGVGLAGGVDVGVASGYVKGGLFGDVEFFLKDCDENPNDGKIRFDGIPFDDPKRIADITGSFSAELRAEVTVGVDPFSVTKEFNIAPPITLFTFDNVHDCPEAQPPILASMDPGNPGFLRLHVGPLSNLRVNGSLMDGDDQIDVVKVDNTIEVRGFGTKMVFPFAGITRIVGDGGEGNDQITIDPTLNIPANLTGGNGNDMLSGGGGNDTIDGGAGNDQVIGNGGDDVLSGGAGDDEIQGGAGNDNIAGNDGNDRLSGGDGNDIIFGGNNNDTISGDAGDDQLHGEVGDDNLTGGAGNDQLRGDVGNDILDGGDGDDIIHGGDGDDRLMGGAGNDSLYGENNNDNLQGNAGDDLLDGGAGDDTLSGDTGNDTLYGQAGRDILFGGAGNDTFFGGTEDDQLYGEGGNDQLSGEAGNDFISGGLGNDSLYGSDGNDTLVGDYGNDYLDGGIGNDIVSGGTGNDSLYGGVGNDSVFGGDGADAISGSDGNDYLDGGTGNDTISADAGNDTVYGRDGLDQIHGGDDNDFIDAGTGADTVTGDAGNDIIYGGTGADNIDAGTGNDYVSGGDDADYIDAGIGNDTVFGGAGDDLIIGGTGNDSLSGDAGSDVIWGGSAAVVVNRSSLLDPIEMELGYSGFRPHLRPDVVTGSIDGDSSDGSDTISGGTENDFLFGGGGNDTVTGDAGDDYIDGGLGVDFVSGGTGNDLIRGGGGNDTLRGDDGRDWVIGDAGDDLVFGDAGESGNQDGQRLYGGAGNDTLYAYAPTTSPSEYSLVGDTLYGGDGDDQLYGNLRKDTLNGDAGNDFLSGDYLAGPAYARNTNVGATGGTDTMYGGYGQDQLFGGGGPDVLFGGPDSDWLEGQGGADQLYGGWGVDILVLDTDSHYGVGEDSFDGHGGNTTVGDSPDLGEVDILLVQGDKSFDGTGNAIFNDTINLTEDAVTGKLNVAYTGTDPNNPQNLRTWQVNWRAGNTPTSKVLVEQVQIAGLMGNDSITATFLPTTITQLAYTQTWLTVIGGGPGNDIIRGTDGPDRLEGGPGSDIMYGNGGDDRLWGDTSNGSAPIDTDTFYGGLGNDDMIGGVGANIMYPWTSETSSHTEDTGLNRVLGSANPSRGDQLYGGTGLDFLYGNGGPDTLYNRDGTKFEDMQNASASGGDAWKNYAKSTNKAWYLSGSAGNDSITINYVTNPYNPLFGRHQVTFQTSGAFDPRFNGFDSYGAFDKSDNRVSTQGPNDVNYDVQNLLIDPVTGQLRSTEAAYSIFQAFGISTTDIVNKVFGPEPSFDAIIIDALGGNDSITVGETVQKTVWVDAGAGDDTVRIQPALAYLPDATDPVSVTLVGGVPVRGNDDKATAYSFGSVSGSKVFRGLTIDSARTDQPDIDYYRFQLSAAPTAGDVIRVKPLHNPLNLNLSAKLIDGSGVQTSFTNGVLDITSLTAGTDYWIRVESIGSIPIDYDMQFVEASASDAAEPNNSPVQAYSLGQLPNVDRLTGLTVSPTDPDWYALSLPATGGVDAAITLTSLTPNAVLTLAAEGLNGEDLGYSVTLIGGKSQDTLSLNSLPAASYRLQVTGDRAARYELRFAGGSVTATGNATRQTSYILPALTDTPVITQTINTTQTQAYFQFALDSAGGPGQAIGIRPRSSGIPITVSLIKLVNGQEQVISFVQPTVGSTAAFSLQGLAAGTYWLQATAPFDVTNTTATFEVFSYTAPTIKTRSDLTFTQAGVTMFNDAGKAGLTRRDVLLGGDGNDVLQGGSGSDWIFGGAGNDVLTGGLDRQVEDLLYGEAGDDIFQVVPDALTLDNTDPSLTRTFDNAAADDFFGGTGNDRVEYLGADGLNGRDFVMLGYDRFLHRYRVGALQLNTADNQFVYQDGLWQLNQAFFQSQDVEGMLVDTRGGADVVHADSGYVFQGQSWGIDRGDIVDRASIFNQLEIDGGAGQDIIYGSAGNDVIFGGADNDYIASGPGDDRILGDTGNDRIAGDQFLASQVPPLALRNGTPDGTTFPTAPVTRNYYAYDLAAQQVARDWNYSGISLPTQSSAVGLSDAFALEGRNDNQGLSRFQPIGDFNGDGVIDYLVTSDTAGGDSYILLGPVTPDQLYRIDTSADIDPSTYPPDIRIRGNHWSYTQSIQDEDAQPLAADAFRIGGEAQLHVSSGLTPAFRMGNIVGDSKNDLIFPALVGSKFHIYAIPGSANPTSSSPVDYYSVAIGSKFSGAQAYALDWDGSGGRNDMLVLATSANAAGSNDTIGYMLLDWFNNVPQLVEPIITSFLAGATFSVNVAGDVNGDRIEDIVVGVTNTVAGNIGREYLALGNIADQGYIKLNTPAIDTAESAYWEGFGLGGGSYSVGDVNRDGLSDIAFGRSVEGTGLNANSVFVLWGSTSYTYGGTIYTYTGTPGSGFNNNLDRLIRRAGRGLTSGYAFGTPQVTAGDFDGDGNIDLAIGLPQSTLSTSPIDPNASKAADPNANRVSVFWNFTTPPRYQGLTNLQFSNAPVIIPGESANDRFGMLASAPRLDLNGDRIDDLVIGAAGADVNSVITNLAAGRVYPIFGGKQSTAAPSPFTQYLTNRDVPGSGLYLVEDPNGQPFVAPGSLTGTGLIDFETPASANQFDIASGSWVVGSGVYQGTADSGGPPAVALLQTTAPVAPSFRLEAQLLGPNDFTQPFNGYFVFDYVSPTDYKFAGLRADSSTGPGGNVDEAFFEIGQMTPAGMVVLVSNPTSTIDIVGLLNKLRIDVVNNHVDLSWTHDPFAFGYVASYDFPADDYLHITGSGATVVLTRLGLLVQDAGGGTFDNAAYSQLEQWYRFSTLGDGQVGDQIQLRIGTGPDAAASRPADRTMYSSSTIAFNFVNPAVVSTALYQSGTTTAALTIQSNGAGGYVASSGLSAGNFDIGGASGRVTLVTLDLTPLMSYIADPSTIESALFYLTVKYTTPSFSGSVTVQTLDAEPDGVLAASDGLAGVGSFSWTQAVTNPLTAYQIDLRSVIMSALSRGRLRVGLRITSDNATTPLRMTFGLNYDPTFDSNQYNLSRLQVVTSQRPGVVAQVFDAAGRQLATNLAIVDLRDYPAGDYFVRVYDPFQDGGGRNYTRSGTVPFRVQIEAPKVGEADAPTDRDEIRGGDGNDNLSGGNAVDRLFGGPGNDTFNAISIEAQDIYTDGADGLTAPPTTEVETLANGIFSQDTIAFAVTSTSPLALALGTQLGLVVTPAGGTAQLLRPIYATDMTQMVELYLRGAAYVPDGLEYATNLEYLSISLASSATYQMGVFEPGIRYGRESLGQLGLQNLRYLDLKDNTLVQSKSQTKPSTAASQNPQTYLGGLISLRFLDLDSTTFSVALTGAANDPWTPISNAASLRWLSMESMAFTGNNATWSPPSGNLTNLQYFVLNHDGTAITFSTPDLSAIANWSSLKEIELRGVNATTIDPFTGHNVVDNQITYAGATGYTEVGPWVGNTNAGAFQGDYRILPSGTAGTASYTLTGLIPGQTYDLWTTWTVDETHTNKARYQIFNGATLLQSADAIQSMAPVGTTFGGVPWQRLVSVTVPAGVTSLRVDLTNAGNGHLIADAVRLTYSVLPNLQLVDVRNNPGLTNTFFDYTETELQTKIGAGLLFTDNAAPVLVNPGTQLTYNGVLQSLTLTGSDSPGQTLKYSAFSSDPQVGLAVVGNRIDITPAAGFTGIVPITVRLSDGGRTTEQTFDIHVGTKSIVGEFPINTYTTLGQGLPQVASDYLGNYVVVWYSDSEPGDTGFGIYGRRYNRDGSARGPEFHVNVSTTNTQNRPTVAMDTYGDFVVAWQSSQISANSYDIYARRYDSNGNPTSGEFRVNTTTTLSQAVPSVALDSNGDFVIAWHSNQVSANGYDVYARRYDSAGNPLPTPGNAAGNEFRINVATLNEQSFPVVGMDYLGDFVVAYNSYNQTGDPTFGIDYRYFDATAGTFGSELHANTYTTNNQSAPAIAMNYYGQFVICWASVGQDGNGLGVYAQRFNADTTKAGGEFQVNAATTGDQTFPTVGIDFNGDFTVVWHSTSSQDGSLDAVFARRYNADGSMLGGEIPVNVYTTNNQLFARVAMDWRGDATIVWASNGEDGSGYGIYGRQYYAAGLPRPASAEQRANAFVTGDQDLADVASAPDGSYVVVWESNGGPGETGYGIFARRHAADGTPLGASDIHVNITTTNDQRYPAISTAGDGSFVVAWLSNQSGTNAVYARSFAADGTPLTGEILVDAPVSSPINLRNVLSVSSASDGRFVVSWYAPDANGDGIYARRYSAIGISSGPRFLVNETQTNQQRFPSVSSAPDFSFVVTWTSFAQDGNQDGIYARRFDNSGTALAGEFLVNTTTSGAQSLSRVGVGGDGSFVIAWHQTPLSGFITVVAQHFTADGSFSGPEFQVNTYTASSAGDAAVAVDARGDFTIAWDSYGEDGGSNAVIARRYEVNGYAIGNEFALNTFATNAQYYAAVAVAADGSFVTAWQSSLQDGSGFGVYSRRFTGSDEILGVKLDANSLPIEGVIVFQDMNGDGVRGPFEPYTVTDANGNYTLRNISGGYRYITEEVPGGYSPIYPTSSYYFSIDGEYLPGFSFYNDRVLSIGADRGAYEGQTLVFNAAFTPTGTWTYQWSVNGVDVPGATDTTFDFTPPDDGLYTVAVTVTDGVTTYNDSARVFALNLLPVVSLPPTLSVNEGDAINFDSLLTDVPADVQTIEWYVDGKLVAGATGTTFTITWPDNGMHVVKVRTHDDDDPTWIESTTNVTVNNVAPQNVTFLPPTGAAEGTPITLIGTFSDPGTLDTQTIAWTITGPGNVVVATGSSATITFTPTDDGMYSASFNVTDNDGGVGMTSATFSVANVAPQTVAATGPTDVDEEQVAGFAVTFTDPGSADTQTIAWTVRDAGNVVVATGTGASLNWTPSLSGLYTVTATVTDDDGGVGASAPLPITVHNVWPRQVSAGPAASGSEGIAITLIGTYRDPGVVGEAFATSWFVTNASGDIVATFSGATFPFVPDDNGFYTATFTVTNTHTGLSTTAGTTVTVTNVVPTAASLTGPATATPGAVTTFTLNNPTDISPADLAAGLHFAFDWDNNGTFDTGDGTYSGSVSAASQNHSFATAGSYTVRGRVIDKDGGFTDYMRNISIAAPSITVQSIVINSGDAQRSRVTQIDVTFSDLVTFVGTPAAAFALSGPGSPTLNVISAPVAGHTVATITFSGTGVIAGSLPDGLYTLNVLSNQITGGLTTGDVQSAFHRLFGDYNGDRFVGTNDFIAFRQSFNGYLFAFDYDGDGSVSTNDFVQFRQRFGMLI
jgi:Ca2+-binding RTX toxin-like protein